MKLKIKKLKILKNQLKNYKLTDFLLRRHFLFKAVHDINEKLIKNKERF